MMLRALWIWQRWIAAAEPKVRRIAFDNAFAPSAMNSLGTVGSSPRETRLSSRDLNRCGILGRPFHQRQRMLVAFAVNPDRGDQHEIVAEMQPVDLDHQKVECGQIGSHEVGQPRRRQRYEPPRGRRLRNPRSGRCRHVTLGQPDSAAEPARRYIDQHQVHRPATEPVFLRRRFPARDRDLAAVHVPDPRALDHDLAAVEADPSPRSAPTMRPPRRIATVARPAGRRHIRLHHRAERLDPRRKAEPIEARPYFRKRFVHSPGRRPTSRCDISRYGVALLCGISTPSLSAQGGQRRPLQKFNRTRDIPTPT